MNQHDITELGERTARHLRLENHPHDRQLRSIQVQACGLAAEVAALAKAVRP